MAEMTASFAPESAPPDAETKTAPASRRKQIVAAVAAVVLLGAGTLWLLGRGHESTDDAQVDAEVVAVPARTGGVVRKLWFNENQRVEAGAVLAELDDAPFKARLQQAEAAVAQATAQSLAADSDATLAERNAVGNRSAARATLAGAAVGERTSAEQLNEGAAQLSSAEAAESQARQDLARARTLVASGAMARVQLDQAETQYRVAESNLKLARARLATLRSSVNAAKSRVEEASARAAQQDVPNAVKLAQARADAARAQVEVARAQRDLAALELSYTRIVAPQAGVMSKKAITVGQQVAPGQAVGQLVTDGRWITANFKETQVGAMHSGQPAKIKIDAFAERTLHGELESLSGGTGSRFTLLPPDNASGNFTKVVQRVPVRVKLTDAPKDLPLRPGMNAEVTLDVRR